MMIIALNLGLSHKETVDLRKALFSNNDVMCDQLREKSSPVMQYTNILMMNLKTLGLTPETGPLTFPESHSAAHVLSPTKWPG